MKKIAAAALVVSLTLVGCSGTPHVEQTNDAEQESQVVSEEVEESVDDEQTFEEERQAVIDYLWGDEMGSLSAISDGVGEIADSIMSQDSETALSAKERVYELCNSIIENDDVPESCETIDNLLKTTAEKMKECAYYYTESTTCGDMEEASELVERGTESLEEAARATDEMPMHISDVKEEYDIVTD